MNFSEQAKKIVEKMTIEERASQLLFTSPGIERLNVPPINWWNEGLHGFARSGTATVFPQAIGLSAMFDDKLMEKVGEVISTEARAKYNINIQNNDYDTYKGLTIWSPNINIFRDPRWGRGQETYGEDPYLTSIIGTSFIRGLQGNEDFLKTSACAKHFAAHSGPEELRHTFNTKATNKDLNETYLYAFEKLVKAGVSGVMGAYNLLNDEPTCASPYLQSILREKWGFKGYFVSDCWAIRDFHMTHKITNSPLESVKLALKNGCQLNCGCTYDYVLEAYEKGLINEEDITLAATKLMEIRLRLGLFSKTPYDDIKYEVVDCKKHKEIALECARKSMVLLKNNGILPLKKVKKLAVIGPNANSILALKGNYYGTSSINKTFLQGLQEIDPDMRVFYSEGCHLFNNSVEPLTKPNDRLSEALAAAHSAEVIVLCLGLDERIEGEQADEGNQYPSGDKVDLRLPKPQRILLKEILSLKKPTIVVLASGSSLNIETEENDALIQAWYPGEFGGTALAEILFGKISPSGKLPITFYNDASLLPDFSDYSMQNRTYKNINENILYPFGYGLSYTSFKFDNIIVKDNIEIDVTNIGNYDGDEVIKVYIDNDHLNPSLCSFKRISLKKGETQKAILYIEEDMLNIYHEDGSVSRNKEYDLTIEGTNEKIIVKYNI